MKLRLIISVVTRRKVSCLNLFSVDYQKKPSICIKKMLIKIEYELVKSLMDEQLLSEIYFIYSRSFVQTVHSHFTPFNFLITLLSMLSFTADFIWCGKQFHILEPNPRKLLISNLTWLFLGTFMFCLYLSLG